MPILRVARSALTVALFLSVVASVHGQSADPFFRLLAPSNAEAPMAFAAFKAQSPVPNGTSGTPPRGSSGEGFLSSLDDFLSSLDDPEDYVPGRGLITLEGVSGMFLNPTSGTLPAGSLTGQYCTAILEQNRDTVYQHTAMASYGVTDWFELGIFGRMNDRPDHLVQVGGGGPLARLRLLTDEGWCPELSVGGMLREGHSTVDKRTAFAAASKMMLFAENPLLLSLRGHVGFRQLWQNSRVAEANGSVVYGGVEIELPYDVYLVGELSNKDDVFNHQPYSFGAQWRPNHVLGLSAAGVQTGGEDQVSLYVGIGATLSLD